MRLSKIIFIIVFTINLLVVATVTQSQDKSDIQHIRQVYKNIKADIAFSKENKFEGKLYCNILEENINNKPWQDIGISHSKIQFWYSGQPWLKNMPGDNPKEDLSMVIENSTIEKKKIYAEYLYENAELIFAFYKSKTEEVRFYYKNGKLIKQLGQFDEGNPVFDLTIINAKKYQNIFLAFLGI